MSDVISRLAPALAERYRIERELGAGGMATVFLAEDVRHRRKVAIKVLHPELSAVLGPDRFLKEIELTAGLQHPHILPLFDSGSADGLLFYVMPFIEGETLRGRLTRESQLPIADAVRITSDVAAALDYAHKRGIVHRDIKPENILLHDGRPLVADFGIALAVQHAGGSRMTQTGMSLGTPQYMAPEQAMGEKSVDLRADIYALGAVCYEMLAGEPPFTGPTAQAIAAKVLTEVPKPLVAQRHTIPDEVEAAVLTALEKLPADRFSSAAAFAEALAGTRPVTRTTRAAAGVPGRVKTGWRRYVAPAHAALTLLALAAVGWLLFQRTPERASDSVSFVLNIPAAERVNELAPSPLALSPDGRTIAYVAETGPRALFVRSLSELTSRFLEGTQGAAMPFFSPDGKWVGFINVAGRKLLRVPLGGGPVETIAENFTAYGAAWGPGDKLVVGGLVTRGLATLPAAGGAAVPLTTVDSSRGYVQHRWPRLLPDGETLLFTSWEGPSSRARIGIASLTSGESTVLDLPGIHPVGVFEGQLFYLRVDGTLMAVAVDLGRRRLLGPPVPVIEGIGSNSQGSGTIAMSRDGSLVYGRGSNSSRMVLVDLHGKARPLLEEPRDYGHPRFSPDGRTIAFDVVGPSTNIWTLDLSLRTASPLTRTGNNDRPEWAAEGKRILYRSDRGATAATLWWQAADGSDSAVQLFGGQDGPHEGMLTPDGLSLVYRTTPAGARRDIWWVRLEGDRKPQPLLNSEFDEVLPRLSPDGRWLAYASDESGVLEVYVRPFPGPGGRVPVSAGGGSEVVWASSGDRLFYRNGRQLVAASVRTVPSFSVLRREVLFEGDFESNLLHTNFDVAPSGNEFVMLAPTGESIEVVVALHWARALGRRASPRTNP